MPNYIRRNIVIAFLDLLIALFAFWISRYFGDLPRWYCLVLSSVIWVLIGLITSKLYFREYKRLRYAFIGLFIVDSITGGLLYLSYKHFIADYYYDYSILIGTGIIFILECILYYSLRLFVYRKIPFFYEIPKIEDNVEIIKEQEVEEIRNSDDAKTIISAVKEENKENIDVIASKLKGDTILIDTDNPEELFKSNVKYPMLILHKRSLNKIQHINTLLSYSNYKLENGGYIGCRCQPSGVRRELINKQSPVPLNHLINGLDWVIHRVIPKLPVVKYLYYTLTKGRYRALTRVEVLGRIYRAGFDVIIEKIVEGELFVVAKKIKEPIRDDKPSNGLLIRLKRKGKNGKIIGVYKFRTMHAYSEYLQPYMYKTEGLAKDGGRYGNDYRVSASGRFMRRIFIDELPMLINWIKGDLKLVGVRPLSNHYFGLYTKDFQELRVKVKPGLLPPFYADKPKSLEEKQESERRYINAYLKNPIRTDWIYFWRIFGSIIFRGTRSE